MDAGDDTTDNSADELRPPKRRLPRYLADGEERLWDYPEKRLAMAMLTQCVWDAVTPNGVGSGCTKNNPRVRSEGLGWMAGLRDAELSFVEVCEALGYHPQWVLEKTRRLAEEVQSEGLDLGGRWLAAAVVIHGG